MKGFIIAAIVLILSALGWYILYSILLPILGPGDGLKAAIIFAWLTTVVGCVLVMIYYANSDPKLKEVFKRINQ